jgi:hypothetical protein
MERQLLALALALAATVTALAPQMANLLKSDAVVTILPWALGLLSIIGLVAARNLPGRGIALTIIGATGVVALLLLLLQWLGPTMILPLTWAFVWSFVGVIFGFLLLWVRALLFLLRGK